MISELFSSIFVYVLYHCYFYYCTIVMKTVLIFFKISEGTL